MIKSYLDFEKPIEEVELQIEELKRLSDGKDINVSGEIKRLEKKVKDLRTDIFSKLTPWQTTLLARHPDRPYTLDYIGMMTDEFVELHGDRKFSDDKAIVGGLARIKNVPVVIIGHQKGRGTKERIKRNFGQPHPEGYRKALRLMELAEKFKRPVITLIDTPGAYPGVGAEERGQAEAIAVNLMQMSRLRVPIIAIVIGEGGSGGALALSVSDRLYMLEHSVYSVISPEGCAAILWKKSSNELVAEDFARAAEALKLTAQDLLRFKIIDEIIPEPIGGAHRDVEQTAKNISEKIIAALEELANKTPGKLVEDRYKKLRKIGSFTEEQKSIS
ncbi:MAG: acetyl-CoA carboxylase carboxyltransferase subunit alpha [Nitrospirae bacterium GWC2_42_7]|nr:MAG: acetyl-CoA carboxylase carboxyltransferase subunit alpha [Nitrospirae bacterium GWC2_42_7]